MPKEYVPGFKSAIFRHTDLAGDHERNTDSGPHLEAVEAHVQRHIGPVAYVIHEQESAYVHMDVLHVPPGEGRDYHTLVTSGMSDRPMNAPEDYPDCQYVELCLRLPASWPLDNSAFSEERHYWPIRLLQTMGRMPHMYNTWLFMFHSMPNCDPPEPYAENTRLCGAMLLPPVCAPQEFGVLKLEEGRKIHFFDVLPLHADEMGYKVRHGAEALLDKFENFDPTGAVLAVVDPARESVIARKRFWLF